MDPLQQGNTQASRTAPAAVSSRLVSWDLPKTSVGNQRKTQRVGATSYRIRRGSSLAAVRTRAFSSVNIVIVESQLPVFFLL